MYCRWNFGVLLASIATFFIDQAFTATMNFGVIAIAFLICTMVGLVLVLYLHTELQNQTQLNHLDLNNEF